MLTKYQQEVIGEFLAEENAVAHSKVCESDESGEYMMTEGLADEDDLDFMKVLNGGN